MRRILIDKKNKLDEVHLAKVSADELALIQDLERQFNEKYYIIAFEK